MEDVTINSQPQGADVFVNNELVGQTPLTVDLPKDGVYELRLAKKGYKDEVVNVASARKDSFIKFGPLVDLGYYKELTPSPVAASMNPDFLLLILNKCFEI
ncbi:MAG: PEGA domain-containing protein [Bacilli bacterium]